LCAKAGCSCAAKCWTANDAAAAAAAACCV
jgi:hypothetical protein